MLMSLSAFTCVLASGLFYMNDPVVSMREGPSSEGRVVSQAVYSEKVEVQEERDGWSNIMTSDGYTGWVPTNSYVHVDSPYEGTCTVSRLAAHVYGINDTEWGPILTLPYGSRLKAIDVSGQRWWTIALPDGRTAYIQKGDVTPEPKLTDKADLVSFSQKFLGLPYTWGGRSSFGYDCSGFVQMLYGQLGIALLRDAKQQIKDERFSTVTIDMLESGDLVFFGKAEDKIRHVGMYVGKGQFIHATASANNMPWIRISNLSDFEYRGQSEALYPYRTFRQLKKIPRS